MKIFGTGHCPSVWLSDRFAGKPTAISRATPGVSQPSFKMMREPNEKPASENGKSGIARPQQGQRGAGIFHFADAVVVLALAQVDAAIVESQHHRAGAPQAARDAIDHFVVHGPAVLRMRMANQNGVARIPIFGLFEQRFQFSGRPIDEQALDAARHLGDGLVGAVVGELHVDAEIVAAQQRDHFLQRVAIFAGDAHQVALDGRLHFLLAVLDQSSRSRAPFRWRCPAAA